MVPITSSMHSCCFLMVFGAGFYAVLETLPGVCIGAKFSIDRTGQWERHRED